MRRMKMTLGLAFCTGLFVTGAIAQDAGTPPAMDHNAMAGHDHAAMTAQAGTNQAMPTHNMMGMASDNGVNDLLDRLNKSVIAIQSEKKSGARKEKLAAHAALLQELQTKLQAQDHMMMGMMGGMNMGKMGGGMGKEMMGRETMGKDAMGKDCCNMAGMPSGAMNCGGAMAPPKN